MTAGRGRDGDAKSPGARPRCVDDACGGGAATRRVGRERGRSPGGAEARAARVRPRRIPGAPGAVLLVPTLCETGDGAEGRRLRRNSGTPASVSPLPPRPSAPDPGDDAERPAASAEVAGPPLAVWVRPCAGRGATRPAARVARAFQGVDLGRFVPDDPEERAERVAKLRRVGVGVVVTLVVCLVIYTVFPVRMALNLFDAEDRARERQAAFERENAILEEEIADLQSDERIEVEAREQGMVHARRGVLRHHAGARARGRRLDQHHGSVDHHHDDAGRLRVAGRPGVALVGAFRPWRGRGRRWQGPRPGGGPCARPPCGCGGCG